MENLWCQRSARNQAEPKPLERRKSDTKGTRPAIRTMWSLVLQYKRPAVPCHGKSRYAQWHHWKSAYYRFAIVQHQQAALAVLEAALAHSAVVRYACPAFWKNQELQTHQQAKTVLVNSTYVSPSALGAITKSGLTTDPTIGFANPDGQSLEAETFNGVWNRAIGMVGRKKENLFHHLRRLGVSTGIATLTDNTTPDWLVGFSDFYQLDPIQRQATFDTLQFAGRTAQPGSSWFVIDLDIKNPK